VAARFLSGRTAWVTGGATGMGRAIALALAEAGADLALGSLPAGSSLPEAAYAARPDLSAFSEIRQAIEGNGVRCLAAALDVREDGSVEDFHRSAVAALGTIDILVNAAGVSAQETMADHDDRTWSSVIDINLNGAYRTIKRCFPAMAQKGWGRIVNIASTAAVVGYPRHSAYCASKAALLGLTRCVALEGAASGITANAINPGSVGTEMMRLGSLRRIAQGGQGATVEENFALIAAATPQKRLIPAEEVAALAVYLCRDEALGITGEALTISGGALW
jgi:NAD(P)-dependent dehydrogenase (short-subunit alcohol dehydrogenase family)